MENKTRDMMLKDKILYVSFKLFLENGYEATNIENICNEVGINESTIYFYYKSKQDLFFYIYDEINTEYLDYLRSLEVLKQDIQLKEKLSLLLKQKIEYHTRNISKQKFILRYHLFPPKEISNVIREKYKAYTNEENKIFLDILANEYNESLLKKLNMNDYLLRYKRLENYLVYDMILSTIRANDEAIQKLWAMF